MEHAHHSKDISYATIETHQKHIEYRRPRFHGGAIVSIVIYSVSSWF